MAVRWIGQDEKKERQKRKKAQREEWLREKGLLPAEEQDPEIYKLNPFDYPTEWAVFSYIDADGSNSITSDELFAGLTELGFGGSAETILKALDDDESNNVTFEEFVDGFQTLWSTNAGKALATAVLDAALKEEAGGFDDEPTTTGAGGKKGKEEEKKMPALGTVDRKEQVAWERAKEKAQENPKRKKPPEDVIPPHLSKDKIMVQDVVSWLAKRPDDSLNRIYEGHLKEAPNQDDAVFRFFLSSTFSDTGAERNYLMQWAYPELRTFCRARGLDFEPVELRWGIREEATDDQQTVNICLSELARCQVGTVGPNFIYIGTDKYGWRPPPERLEATIFEKLHGLCSSDDKRILDTWYMRNGNLEPPMYMLQKISAILPDFLSSDVERQRAASGNWWEAQQGICHALNSAANTVQKRSGERVWTHISVTEQEVLKGLIHPEDNKKTALFFHREIQDIELNDPNARMWKDCIQQGVRDDNADMLLRRIQERVRSALPHANIYKFKVAWNPDGITLQNSNEHVRQFCADLSQCMRDRIDLAISANPPKDPLSKEIVDHARTAYHHSTSCWGREKVVSRIIKYIRGEDDFPLVVSGLSGVGKTAVMGKVAQEAKIDNEHRMILIRFCGQTADSAVTTRLLRSICMQLAVVYGVPDEPPDDAEELQKGLPQWLELATREKPLCILIDSLDMIERPNDESTNNWIPRKLPPYCKMVVSCLPDDENGMYQMLQERLVDVEEQSFITLRGLEVSKVDSIIDHWLSRDERQLQAVQRAELRTAVTQSEEGASALLLSMAYHETRRWASYDIVTPLPRSVYGLIDSLFDWLERYHSTVLLSHTFGYLAACRHGLSEKELLDLLSCDEEVLNAVLQYHQPPQRRLPPLVFTRLRNDLSGYLVEMGADGTVVLGWAHRPFWEAAGRRYAATVNVRRERAKMLADYFDGVLFLKHYSRSIDAQPLYFGEKKKEGGHRVPNLRKLSELPYALSAAGELERLKERLADLEMFTAMAGDEVMKFDLMECWREIESNDEEQGDLAKVYMEALQMEEEKPDEHRRSPAELAQLYDLTVDVLNRSTKYDAAVKMCTRSLEIRKEILGDSDPAIAATYSTLGTLLGSVGKYDEALKLNQMSQEILQENAKGGDDGEMSPEVCKSLSNLAGMHMWLGEYEEARKLYKQVNDVMEGLYNVEHPIVATLHNNLGSLYQQMGDPQRAIEMLEPALNVLKIHLGPSHPNVSNAMSNLATAYIDVGKLAEAEELLELDVGNTERVLGASHPDLAVSLNNQALCYMKLKKHPKARKLAFRAKEIYMKVFGNGDDEGDAEHTLLAGTLNTLGCIHVDMGELDAAVRYFQESADMVDRILGSNHPRHAFVTLNLAFLLKSLAREKEALPLFEKVANAKRQVLPAEEDKSPEALQYIAEAAQSVEELAEVHQSLGQFAEALALREEAVNLYARALGEQHMLVTSSLNELAVLYEKLGGDDNHQKALACVERRLKSGSTYGSLLLPAKR